MPRLVNELRIDRDWLTKPRSYYLYRGSEEVAEVYILRGAIRDDPPVVLRLLLEWDMETEPVVGSRPLELREDMLEKVDSRYVYWARDKLGGSQIVGGVYVLRSALGGPPPELVYGLLESESGVNIIARGEGDGA